MAIGCCCRCEESGRISYNRMTATDEEREKLDAPLGEVLDVKSGEKLTLGTCADCDGPTAAIDEKAFPPPTDPKALYCPACGKQPVTGPSWPLLDP
ncbi:MAG: hypothetical protein JW889_09775 [Verrucomicrobia bacterium]|nr:hypothetical protein [Verrucomicrobiota bacterium]